MAQYLDNVIGSTLPEDVTNHLVDGVNPDTNY